MIAQPLRKILVALVATLVLTSCGDSQPTTNPASPAVRQRTIAVRTESLDGYYLTKLYTAVGNALPESSFCFGFKKSGVWSNTGSESFGGTYLTSHDRLYASAVWLPSPAVYLTLEGTVGIGSGAGHFIVSSGNGSISGGGTYTMKQEHSPSCS